MLNKVEKTIDQNVIEKMPANNSAARQPAWSAAYVPRINRADWLRICVIMQ